MDLKNKDFENVYVETWLLSALGSPIEISGMPGNTEHMTQAPCKHSTCNILVLI